MTTALKNYGLVFLFMTLLSACGDQVCVMGFGKCEAPEKPATQTTATLTLTISKEPLAFNEEATVTIAGGTPNYKIEFDGTALGNLTATGATMGSFSSVTSWTYKAPNQAATVTFKVTDQANPAHVVKKAVVIQ